jgi:hypothetical protein
MSNSSPQVAAFFFFMFSLFQIIREDHKFNLVDETPQKYIKEKKVSLEQDKGVSLCVFRVRWDTKKI